LNRPIKSNAENLFGTIHLAYGRIHLANAGRGIVFASSDCCNGTVIICFGMIRFMHGTYLELKNAFK